MSSPNDFLRLKDEYAHLADKPVALLASSNGHGWNVNFIMGLFVTEDATRILQIPGPHPLAPDRCVWVQSKCGKLAIKFFFNHKYNHFTDVSFCGLWKLLWKLCIPPRLLMLGLKIFYNILPTSDMLQGRNILVDSTCVFCKHGEETALHLFSDCCMSAAVWFVVLC